MHRPCEPIRETQPVAVGQHLVGPDCPTLVVAEAGVNHDGDLATALRLVDAAVEAGADAVKFQAFRASELVSTTAPMAAYQTERCADESQHAMLSRLELSQNEFHALKQRCDERKVLFLATPFGETSIRELVEIGVEAIKIASTDLANPMLMHTALETNLPLIVSTGASSEEEIRTCVASIVRAGAADRLVLLHCVSCYPTPLSKLNLRGIRSLQRAFRVPCGLSDHTTSTDTGAWGVAAGACLVEKHFSLDPTRSGPDHAMSLDPTQLAKYISAVRRAEQVLGTGAIGMTDAETDVRRAAGRSVVTGVAVAAGSVLTRDVLAVKRPGTGNLTGPDR